MKMKQFIEKIKNTSNLKEILEVRTYIPIAEKKAILETVLNECFDIEDGVPTCDYVFKKIAFELAMVKYHTDLDVDITSEDDYDAIQDILGFIHGVYLEDYQECHSLFEGMEREFREQYSIESSIARLSNKISNSIGSLASSLTDKVSGFDMSSLGLEGVELDQLKNLFSKYGG